ncbi:MAG: aminomethyl-transferring glycine dehydrogenase subunit GcvPB [Legionellales bacterium]|nr:aminomethyl-transferring glycine dehydrogenase subunit GcvPB [Legionellales bacterium]
MLIFEKSQPNRQAHAQLPGKPPVSNAIPAALLRKNKLVLPELSELEVVRHFTQLSRKNFSIDTNFYPLGSCTMKYNPRGVHRLASLPGFLNRHPLAHENSSQGFLQCLYELQTILADVTGMAAVSLAPMAGAQGEFAGVAMIAAYHRARGDHHRVEMLVPDAAHGTNPASAVCCGLKVREIPTSSTGDVDVDALKAAVGPNTAGIMLTNPSTLGVFDRNITEIAKIIHEAGGLLYYDGANLNAILGKVRPGDMGFDVMHMNLHKTFATPHGGGGPGAGPVAVAARLKPFLPLPFVINQDNKLVWSEKKDFPESIGRLSCFMGNAGILLRAYAYARLLGAEGMTRVAEFATLNANYLQKKLQELGYRLAYPLRRASHEFIITVQKEAKQFGITATDIAKRLLDYGIHAPTMYFPLLVPECLLIEPTETESKQTLDRLVDVLKIIRQEIQENPQLVKTAPHTLPVKRLDDVKAARDLDLVWKSQAE